MEIIFGSDFYIKNPGLLTLLSVLFNKIFIYDSFDLFYNYQSKYSELKISDGRPGRMYHDPVARFENARCRIETIFSYPIVQEYIEYIKWLEKYHILFREQILNFGHIGSSVPSRNIVEILINEKSRVKTEYKDLESVAAKIECMKIENFYMSLCLANYHKIQFGVDSQTNYEVPKGRFDIVDKQHTTYVEKSLKTYSGNGINSKPSKVDQVAIQLAVSLSAMAFAELPPLYPYEICKLRQTLSDERAAVVDGLRSLTKNVSEILSSGIVDDIKEACDYIIESQVMPRYRNLISAVKDKSSSDYKSKMQKLIEPAILTIKALDPTEVLSKWDVLKEGAKLYFSEDKEKQELAPEEIVSTFTFKLSDELKKMRPSAF